MEKVKVKFLRSHPDFGYFAGDSAELTAKQAAELAEGKYIQEDKPEPKKKEAPTPETTTIKAPEVHTRTTTTAKKADHKKKH